MRSLKLRNLYTMAGFDFNLFMEYTGIDLNIHKTLVRKFVIYFQEGIYTFINIIYLIAIIVCK